MPHPYAARLGSVQIVVKVEVALHAHHAVEHRDVELLPLAGAVALSERHHRAQGDEKPRYSVADGNGPIFAGDSGGPVISMMPASAWMRPSNAFMSR